MVVCVLWLVSKKYLRKQCQKHTCVKVCVRVTVNIIIIGMEIFMGGLHKYSFLSLFVCVCVCVHLI